MCSSDLFGYIGPRRKEMSAVTWDDVDYRKSDRPTAMERAKTDAATARTAAPKAGLEDDYVQPTPARP